MSVNTSFSVSRVFQLKRELSRFIFQIKQACDELEIATAVDGERIAFTTLGDETAPDIWLQAVIAMPEDGLRPVLDDRTYEALSAQAARMTGLQKYLNKLTISFAQDYLERMARSRSTMTTIYGGFGGSALVTTNTPSGSINQGRTGRGPTVGGNVASGSSLGIATALEPPSGFRPSGPIPGEASQGGLSPNQSISGRPAVNESVHTPGSQSAHNRGTHSRSQPPRGGPSASGTRPGGNAQRTNPRGGRSPGGNFPSGNRHGGSTRAVNSSERRPPSTNRVSVNPAASSFTHGPSRPFHLGQSVSESSTSQPNPQPLNSESDAESGSTEGTPTSTPTGGSVRDEGQ